LRHEPVSSSLAGEGSGARSGFHRQDAFVPDFPNQPAQALALAPTAGAYPQAGGSTPKPNLELTILFPDRGRGKLLE
jgi:hypothetical protein